MYNDSGTNRQTTLAHDKIGDRKYVLKKHASQRLHYDFRFEDRGLLISFVVPEGPSADPHTKRRAILVAPHDIEYWNSEREIPQGHYGAGTVMVWDIGTCNMLTEDLGQAIREGKIELFIYGERIHGRWILAYERGNQWWLIKDMDEYADPGNPDGLIDAYDTSATTGRTMEEIRDGTSINANQDDQLDFWTFN